MEIIQEGETYLPKGKWMVIKTKVLPNVPLFNAYLNMLQLILNVLQVCNNNLH